MEIWWRGGKPHILPFGWVVTLLLSVQRCLFGSLALRWFNRSDLNIYELKTVILGRSGKYTHSAERPGVHKRTHWRHWIAHTQTGTHTLTHSDTVTLIILEININLHTVEPTRGFLRIPVKLKRFWTCFCRCYQLCLGKGFISSKLRSTLQAFLSVLYSFQHFTSRCISPESRYLSHTVWRLNSQDKLWVRHFKNQVKIRNLAIRSFYLIPASH